MVNGTMSLPSPPVILCIVRSEGDKRNKDGYHDQEIDIHSSSLKVQLTTGPTITGQIAKVPKNATNTMTGRPMSQPEQNIMTDSENQESVGDATHRQAREIARELMTQRPAVRRRWPWALVVLVVLVMLQVGGFRGVFP